jgi:tRNA-splicing ligase RtcB
MDKAYNGPLERIDAWRWRIPASYKAGMRVPGIIYADEEMLKAIKADSAPDQVANVACLPGIQHASLAMPDIHWGYGFCIGGVAATDPEAGGVISPGGVGYDINCGVRLIRTDLDWRTIKPRVRELVDALYSMIPTGVGMKARFKFNRGELREMLVRGSPYLVDRGLAPAADIAVTEAGGCLPDADPEAVSETAYKRGEEQCGSLGSGNHFMEVQIVEHVFDETAAAAFGLFQNQVCVMIHSGSRGLGYQVCDDYLTAMRNTAGKYGIELPDKQLISVPVKSPEGEKYLGAMRAAANFAWCNRQMLTHGAREVFGNVFGDAVLPGMRLVYDVCHNIAKFEEYDVNGRPTRLCVHRKGATRAFPPGHPEIPEIYRAVGQPVLIPGDMGRASFVLRGAEGSMRETFGTTCHGAGRAMSRTAAKKRKNDRQVQDDLLARGVVARARGKFGLAEEQPEAYKDVNDVVDVVHNAGISMKVARMKPIGVIKG